MSVPSKPGITRLRWVSAKDPLAIQSFLREVGQRVHINQIVFAQGKWFLWFTPGDADTDIPGGDLDR